MEKIYYFSKSIDFIVFAGHVSAKSTICDNILTERNIDMNYIGIKHIYESSESEFYTFEELYSGYVYFFHKSKMENFIKNCLNLQNSMREGEKLAKEFDKHVTT